MSAQQPASSLTKAAALLNNILASVETVRTLSNVTTTRQQPTAPSVDMLDSLLASLFPSRQPSSGLPASAAPVSREDCVAQVHQPQCMFIWCFSFFKFRLYFLRWKEMKRMLQNFLLVFCNELSQSTQETLARHEFCIFVFPSAHPTTSCLYTSNKLFLGPVW